MLDFSLHLEFCARFSFEWVLPCSLPLLFEALKLAIGSTRGRVMWKASFMATIWSIWKSGMPGALKARCLRSRSVDKVKFLVSSWVSCFSQSCESVTSIFR